MPKRKKATPEEVRALAHPLRLRIIRELYDGPRSNKELATALGEDPATVLYHVRTLSRTGFVRPAGTRPGARGSTEKLYKSTGKSWTVDVDIALPAAASVSRAALDAFLGEVQTAGAVADLETWRLALVVSPTRRKELERRVGALLDEYAMENDSDGEPWAIFVALHRRT
jgi:DNA-binding transcriptional ArsR family regulator